MASETIPMEHTKAELDVINFALMMVEYMDAQNPTTDPVFREAISQRRLHLLPLRLKIFQAVNRTQG